MDSATPPQSTLDTLRTVEFRLGLKGYNVDEVDEYLEKAAVEAEAMQEQMRQLTDRLRQAGERIGQLEGERREAPAPVPAPVAADPVADESLQRTLILAQKFVDETKRESEAEAALVLSQAEERARATLAEADERARALTREAEQGLRVEVGRLEGLRAQLANDVENMARHLDQERNRLRGALSEILKWVDENVQPAASLMAQRPAPGAKPVASDEAPVAQAPVPTEPPATNGAAVADTGDNTVAQVLDLRGGPGPAPGPSAAR